MAYKCDAYLSCPNYCDKRCCDGCPEYEKCEHFNKCTVFECKYKY